MADHDLERRIHRLAHASIDPDVEASHLAAIARLRARRSFTSKLRIGGVFLAGLLVGSTGLAAADALPDPAQRVAHDVLDPIGIDVPEPTRHHGPECGDEVKRNHGQYVRDDKDLARSDCGKPVGGDDLDGEDDGDGRGGPPAGDDPCRGRPPWAGNKDMTTEQRAAAQAERAATCGADDTSEVEEEVEADVEQEPAADPTTTTAAPTTTTTVASTTTTATTAVLEDATTTTAP